MKRLFLLLFLFIGVFVVSCGDDDTTGTTKPVVTSITPKTPLPGDEMIVTGQGFGADASLLQINLSGIECQVDLISDTEIKFTIPEDISGILEEGYHPDQGSRTITVTLLSSIGSPGAAYHVAGLSNVAVTLQEPKGWFHQKKLNHLLNADMTCFTATSDTTLWIAESRSGMIRKSIDGGNTWTHINYPGQLNAFSKAPAYFIDDQTAWLASSRYPEPYYTIAHITDGEHITGTDTPKDPEFVIKARTPNWIEAIWAKDYNNGLMMKIDGVLIGFFGGFSSGYWAIVYQNEFLNFKALSAVSMEEFTIFATAVETEEKKLIYKKEGAAPFEYNVDQYLGTIGSLQHMSNGMIYVNDRATKNFYRIITQPLSITPIGNQKADMFHFINHNTAYVVLGNTIQKTTDGGQTWNKEFTVNAPYILPIGIAEHNGHVWVLMEDGAITNKEYMLVKYNP